MTDFTADIRNGLCPVCRGVNPSIEREPTSTRTLQARCATCGDYDITFEAMLEVSGWSTDSPYRALISEWIWENNSIGGTPRISPDNLAALKSRRLLPFFGRAQRLLIFLANHTNTLGASVSLSDVPQIAAMLQARKKQEVNIVGKFLQDQGWVAFSPNIGIATVLAAGFIQAEEWKGRATQSAQGFVAMWFDKSTAEAWEHGLHKGISGAGYQPLRIDKTEHVNKICDEIVAQIRRSRFIVADYTGHRAGVYYEAGYASGRDLPVILTCKKDEIDKPHFDVRQFNCIDWESPAELAERLQARIEAVIGDGPLKSN